MDRAPKTALRAKPRLSRAEQNAERSQQLLASAWTLFVAKGYEAVTIDAVAEHAGYSRMPIYSLFGDKQTLFFELWRGAVAELSRMLIGTLKDGVPLRRNLKLLAETVARSPSGDTAQQPAERLFFVVQTIALSRPDIEAKLEQLARQVVDDMAAKIRASTLEPGERLRSDALTVAAHLVAHINGMATVQFQTHRSFSQPRDLAAIFQAIALEPAHA